MIVYRFRPDMVYDCPVDLPGPSIPKYHTFQAPPEIPDGSYAIMRNGWQVNQGVPPVYPPLPVPPTPEQIGTLVVEATQKRLDDFARTRNYDGILSACTYAASSVPQFHAEGTYCIGARDATWATLYTILAQVQAGTHVIPTGYSDIEPELPPLIWPV